MEDFRVQIYEDLAVDKDVLIRKEVLEVYNKHKEDFDTRQDYHHYLVLVHSFFYNTLYIYMRAIVAGLL